MDGLKAMLDDYQSRQGGGGDASEQKGALAKSPGEGETHSMHHFNAGGKHHVTRHHSGGVEHSEHEAGSGGGVCPLCGKS